MNIPTAAEKPKSNSTDLRLRQNRFCLGLSGFHKPSGKRLIIILSAVATVIIKCNIFSFRASPLCEKLDNMRLHTLNIDISACFG